MTPLSLSSLVAQSQGVILSPVCTAPFGELGERTLAARGKIFSGTPSKLRGRTKDGLKYFATEVTGLLIANKTR